MPGIDEKSIQSDESIPAFHPIVQDLTRYELDGKKICRNRPEIIWTILNERTLSRSGAVACRSMDGTNAWCRTTGRKNELSSLREDACNLSDHIRETPQRWILSTTDLTDTHKHML